MGVIYFKLSILIKRLVGWWFKMQRELLQSRWDWPCMPTPSLHHPSHCDDTVRTAAALPKAGPTCALMAVSVHTDLYNVFRQHTQAMAAILALLFIEEPGQPQHTKSKGPLTMQKAQPWLAPQTHWSPHYHHLPPPRALLWSYWLKHSRSVSIFWFWAGQLRKWVIVITLLQDQLHLMQEKCSFWNTQKIIFDLACSCARWNIR